MHFFVYVLTRNGVDTPHVLRGTQESLDQTRRLVRSGAQASELTYLGPVLVLEPLIERDKLTVDDALTLAGRTP